jgi:cytidylate kinase
MAERRETVIICVCGMTGSGKSTTAKRLAQKYGLAYFSGGDALKSLALDAGYKTIETGWWETEDGLNFSRQRIKDPTFDKRVDEKLLQLAKRGSVVLDSWTMAWLLKGGFKVWLEASQSVRARRVAGRDGLTVVEALDALKKKDEKTASIYKNLYGFELGKDFSPFDMILDTDELTVDKVFQAVCLVVDRLVFG